MVGELTHFVDGGCHLDILETGYALTRSKRTHILVQCVELGSQVEEVDESILLVAYIDEGGIESRHNLTNSTQIDVAHGESSLAFLLAQLDEHLILGESNGYFGRRNVDYQFLAHNFWRRASAYYVRLLLCRFCVLLKTDKAKVSFNHTSALSMHRHNGHHYLFFL